MEKPKVKKKVYAEVRGTVSFITDSKEEGQKLVEYFFKRKGITKYGEVEFAPEPAIISWGGAPTRVTFEASYRVHGGWRSDFVKKVESDSQDTNVTITGLEVNINRTEIPDECPRKECQPCSFQLGVIPTYATTPEEDREVAETTADIDVDDNLFEQIESEIDKPGVREKLRLLLGGKN